MIAYENNLTLFYRLIHKHIHDKRLYYMDLIKLFYPNKVFLGFKLGLIFDKRNKIKT
jgi:hypothetical protein